MLRFLITVGPTREYLDGVRFLSNASSGRMGMALAEAILEAGHAVDLVVGPVEVPAPAGCEVDRVETTRQMYDATLARLDRADVVIAAAAVCDFRPAVPHAGKLKKTGGRLVLEFVETEDILAEIGRRKGNRFVLGFALEASDGPAHARRKMRDKGCDAIVLNAPAAIGAAGHNSLGTDSRRRRRVVADRPEAGGGAADRRVGVVEPSKRCVNRPVARPTATDGNRLLVGFDASVGAVTMGVRRSRDDHYRRRQRFPGGAACNLTRPDSTAADG